MRRGCKGIMQGYKGSVGILPNNGRLNGKENGNLI